MPLRPVFTRYGNELNQASTRPLNCFQFPSIRFQSIAHSYSRKSQLAQKTAQCMGGVTEAIFRLLRSERRPYRWATLVSRVSGNLGRILLANRTILVAHVRARSFR